MTIERSGYGCCALALALLCGCGTPGKVESAVTAAGDKCLFDERDRPPNGPDLNGTSLGAARVLAGVRLADGVTLAGGRTAGGATVDGTTLIDGDARGAAFTGARLAGADDDGTRVDLYIDAVKPGDDPEILLYSVSYAAPGAGGKRSSICYSKNEKGEYLTDKAGQRIPLPAVAVAGLWDYHIGHRGDGRRLSSASNELTFACIDSAIAKCALLGYRPWKAMKKDVGGQSVDVPLAELHEACVRAVRADYCGRSIPRTHRGVIIGLHDAFGVLADTGNWPLEAQWAVDGAVCVGDPENPRTATPRIKPRGPGCTGDQPAPRALVMTQTAPDAPR